MAWRLLAAQLPHPVDDGGRRRRADRQPGRRHRLGRGARARTSATQWRLAELTVNYRTPAEIMAVAADVLAAGDAHRRRRRSVRSTGRATGGRAGGRGPSCSPGPPRPTAELVAEPAARSR